MDFVLFWQNTRVNITQSNVAGAKCVQIVGILDNKKSSNWEGINPFQQIVSNN